MKYQEIDTTKVILDIENPRISDILVGVEGTNDEIQDFIKDHLTGDTGNSEPGPSCLELKKSIYQSKGIIEPIIVLDKKDGTFLCVEGNTRLSIYLKFMDEYSSESTWKKIPSLVHEELSVPQIDALRLQAHFVGKKEWTPYAKGRYITKLINGGMQLADIKEIVGGSDAKIRANYHAYDAYIKFYEPLFKEDEDGMLPDKQKMSMFTAVPKGGRHALALEERGHTIEDFAIWVKEDKVGSANDVRRFFDQIMINDEAYETFISSGKKLSDAIIKLPKDTNVNNVSLKDASYTQICEYLSDALLERRNKGTLSKIKEQEGSGVIDFMNLLNNELQKSIEILEE